MEKLCPIPGPSQMSSCDVSDHWNAHPGWRIQGRILCPRLTPWKWIKDSLFLFSVKQIYYLNWSERLLVMDAEKVLALEVDLVKSSITGWLWIYTPGTVLNVFIFSVPVLSVCCCQARSCRPQTASSQLFHDLLQMLLMVLGWVWSWQWSFGYIDLLISIHETRSTLPQPYTSIVTGHIKKTKNITSDSHTCTVKVWQT